MDIDALKTELAGSHPATGPYDADSSVAAGQLNAVNCTRDRSSMTGTEVLNAINGDEWATLTDAQRDTIWNILHLGTLNPFGVEATLMSGIFGASATITALQTARVESVSRATLLGLSFIYPGHVEIARA